MFNNSPFFVNKSVSQLGRRWQQAGFPVTQRALHLYQQARSKGRLGRVRARVLGRSNHLLDLREIETGATVRERWHAGLQTVPLARILGSAGRCQDFDAHFWPLRLHNRGRWLSVATARELGAQLPPVKLVEVDGILFVQDGHHRISVARVLGQVEIEAEVTVWQVEGLEVWQQATPAGWSTRLLCRLAWILVALGGRLVQYGLPAHQSPGRGEERKSAVLI